MNLKNKKLRDDYIDLSKIIISLWEKKFLIFIVTLIFMVAGLIIAGLFFSTILGALIAFSNM